MDLSDPEGQMSEVSDSDSVGVDYVQSNPPTSCSLFVHCPYSGRWAVSSACVSVTDNGSNESKTKTKQAG